MTCIPAKSHPIEIIQNNFFNLSPRNSCQRPSLTPETIQDLVKGLARLEGRACRTSLPPPRPESHCLPKTPQGTWGVAANETGRIWGDPHFEEADGGKFDVQGEAGKTYNLLNDTGLQLNGRFDGAPGQTTVVGQTGLTLTGLRGSSQIQFDKQGQALLDQRAMRAGMMETLADGGHAHLSQNGKTLTIMSGEGYTITQEAKGHEMEIRVKSPNEGVASDARMPGGLLGQTFDADKSARNSREKQGEGAIAGTVRDYEVAGVFGTVSPLLQRGAAPETVTRVGQLFQNAGATPPLTLPHLNPVTGVPVDWNQSVTDQTLDFMIGQGNRQTIFRQVADSNHKGDKLLQMLLAALQTGNIDLAMLLFSSVESREATQLTKALTQKLLEAQENRRRLTGQLTSQDKNAQNQTAQVQANVQEVNDTIQLLTTFIKDVNEQKNRTTEFASNFLNGEHQTTMSIVRGMKS